MIAIPLLLFASTAVALHASPKPGVSAQQRSLREGYKSLHGKHGPVASQLAAFNDLEYHAHTRYYAKSLGFNEVVYATTDVGPFNVSFHCTSSAVEAFIGIQNNFKYPITYHGNFLSGADSDVVNLLNEGEGVNLKVAEFTGATTVGVPESTGAILLSNGYFISLGNADSYLMSVSADESDDRMPNSDCTVAGFMNFAHPKGGKYYDGFLYEDLLLEQASQLSAASGGSGSIAAAVAGGAFVGVLVGAAVVVAATLLVTKNRSLLLHAVGYYDSFASQCTTPMDSSSAGLTGGAAAPSSSSSSPPLHSYKS